MAIEKLRDEDIDEDARVGAADLTAGQDGEEVSSPLTQYAYPLLY
jgi:hypothetical protein